MENNSFENSKVYLKVPYNSKNVVKQHGGRWDPMKKMWYVPKNINKFKLEAILSTILGVTVPKHIYTDENYKPTTAEKFKLLQDWKKDDIIKNYEENRQKPLALGRSSHDGDLPAQITKSIFN
jgi:hypothetical protein